MSNDPDTYGWDTVFAISTGRVNQALANLPASPSYSTTEPMSGGTATLNWNFVDWQVTDTPGGGQMEVTMAFGSGSQLILSTKGTFDLTKPGYACSVTFQAFFSDGSLVANTGANQNWATVNISVPSGVPIDVQIALTALLVDWFKGSDALDLFKREFLRFDMTSDVGKDDLPWLLPKQPLGFAGGVMADGVTKAIGILAITTTTSSGGPKAPGQLMLSPYAIPANAAAGFVLSRELVMTNLIKPAVAGAFSTDGTGNLANFDLSQTTFQLTNTSDLSFEHELNGTQQPCSISAGNLKLWQEGDRLYMTIQPMTMQTEIAGLLLDALIDERIVMSLAPKPNDPNAQIFVLSNVDPQTPNVSHRFTREATVAAAVIGALIAGATLVLGVVSFKGMLMKKAGLTSQMAKVWARVILAIVGALGVISGFVPMIIAAARDGKVEDIPDIGPLISTSLSRISWPGGAKTKFVATDGRFATGILLTIDPQVS